MRFYFLELLACPKCKSTNIALHVLREEARDVSSPVEKLKCRRFCGLYEKPASEVSLEECERCVKRVVVDGVIICRDCGRWYPVVDTIPVMLTDKYRGGSEDRSFLKKYWSLIPDELKSRMRIPEPRDLL